MRAVFRNVCVSCNGTAEPWIIRKEIADIDGAIRKRQDTMKEKARILFICTANAARSQMAEGLLRAKYGERFDVYSAGTRQSRVNPYAIQVMAEIGVDISRHRSKTIDALQGMRFDLACTLCNNARRICPDVPCAGQTIHCGFPDPHLTRGSEEEILNGYRQVRDGIAAWIEMVFRSR